MLHHPFAETKRNGCRVAETADMGICVQTDLGATTANKNERPVHIEMNRLVSCL